MWIDTEIKLFVKWNDKKIRLRYEQVSHNNLLSQNSMKMDFRDLPC